MTSRPRPLANPAFEVNAAALPSEIGDDELSQTNL
jgi:hypothetical protein